MPFSVEVCLYLKRVENSNDADNNYFTLTYNSKQFTLINLII
jgi:hypothetical protein